jgi:hypothetical protein
MNLIALLRALLRSVDGYCTSAHASLFAAMTAAGDDLNQDGTAIFVY